jgi:hypothetical protein
MSATCCLSLGNRKAEACCSAWPSQNWQEAAQADELLKAMKGWIERRRWVAQREELAGQTPSVSELQQRKW